MAESQPQRVCYAKATVLVQSAPRPQQSGLLPLPSPQPSLLMGVFPKSTCNDLPALSLRLSFRVGSPGTPTPHRADGHVRKGRSDPCRWGSARRGRDPGSALDNLLSF